jgi:hypothetical protein
MIEIGSRLAVFKEADDKYYEATVTGERNEKRPFLLEYIHGNHEWWVDLRQYKYRVLPGGTRYHVNVGSETKNADNGGGKLAASMKLQGSKHKRKRSEDSSSEEDTSEEEDSDDKDSKVDEDLVVAKESSITEERCDIMLRRASNMKRNEERLTSLDTRKYYRNYSMPESPKKLSSTKKQAAAAPVLSRASRFLVRRRRRSTIRTSMSRFPWVSFLVRFLFNIVVHLY